MGIGRERKAGLHLEAEGLLELRDSLGAWKDVIKINVNLVKEK